MPGDLTVTFTGYLLSLNGGLDKCLLPQLRQARSSESAPVNSNPTTRFLYRTKGLRALTWVQ